MRSRERLIDVLRTVNSNWFGYGLADTMREAGNLLSNDVRFSRGLRRILKTIALTSASPHIAELAFEALRHDHKVRAR